MYSRSHAVLNDKDGALWQNMGLWWDSHSGSIDRGFTRASQRLFNRILTSTIPQTERVGELRVLDVGCGCGDEVEAIGEYFTRFTAGPKVTACTLARVQASAASDRFRNGTGTAFEVDIHNAEAVAFTMHQQPASFDVVVACDCLYHLRTRAAFLEGCRRVLVEGGVFACADLVVCERRLSWWEEVRLQGVCLISGTVRENLVPPSTYRAQLVGAGFSDKSIQIDVLPHEHTFLPLADHIHKVCGSGSGAQAKATYLVRQGFLAVARMLRWWASSGIVSMAVIRATTT
ncbi:hypothetical protein PYCC9005_005621 [Savitreella phatthalungensis]